MINRPLGAAQARALSRALSRALARTSISAHIWPMAGRPCNPDSDLKRLWRTLLPGTPFPQCGVPAQANDAERAEAWPADEQPADEAKPPLTGRAA